MRLHLSQFTNQETPPLLKKKYTDDSCWGKNSKDPMWSIESLILSLLWPTGEKASRLMIASFLLYRPKTRQPLHEKARTGGDSPESDKNYINHLFWWIHLNYHHLFSNIFWYLPDNSCLYFVYFERFLNFTVVAVRVGTLPFFIPESPTWIIR